MNSPQAPDTTERIRELAKLQDGWLDGAGKALNPVGLNWLITILPRLTHHLNLPTPFLYPTEEGNISAEWSLDDEYGPLEVRAHINLTERTINIYFVGLS